MRIRSNPVLTRELRGRIRGQRALVMLVAYLTITAIVTLLVYAASASAFERGINDPEAGRGIGKGIFLTVMVATLVQVCVISPALTAGAISGEKERQTYDLLLISLLSPWQIVLGKLVAALAFALLMIIAALPLAGLAFLFGGVSGAELLIGIIGILVTTVCYATIGLLASALMRSTLSATVLAQGIVIALLLGVPFLFFVISTLTDTFSGPWEPWYVYVMGLFLSIHPFIALGLTAASLAGGEDPFFLDIPTRTGQVIVPSPWMVYLALSLILTLVCLVLCIRLLKPTEYAAPRSKTAPR
ncbi:MAG: ABC transporter permease [Chloroflexaceae bacterium]|nr:ABC transporter permease [Chloroflexaceae bacterium]